MTIGPDQSAHVLHVGSPEASAGEAPLAQLAWASVRVEHCDDVYRALARLGANGSHAMAILVCLDELDPREMEFFRIAARYHAATPVYVYAQPRYESRVARAVELGARGRFTPSVIRILADPVVPIASGPSPVRDDQPAGPPPVAEVVRRVRLVEPVEPPDDVEFLEEEEPLLDDAEEAADLPIADAPLTDEDLPHGPARVPWLRYAETPPRQPPPGQAPLSPRPPSQGAPRQGATPLGPAAAASVPPAAPSCESEISDLKSEISNLKSEIRSPQSDFANPQSAGSAGASPSHNPQSDEPLGDYEPLLTLEELEALIGDDNGPPLPRPDAQEGGRA